MGLENSIMMTKRINYCSEVFLVTQIVETSLR